MPFFLPSKGLRVLQTKCLLDHLTTLENTLTTTWYVRLLLWFSGTDNQTIIPALCRIGQVWRCKIRQDFNSSLGPNLTETCRYEHSCFETAVESCVGVNSARGCARYLGQVWHWQVLRLCAEKLCIFKLSCASNTARKMWCGVKDRSTCQAWYYRKTMIFLAKWF